ncbi:MAG: MarR family transcriptional regulator [Caulobacteraceae bacterium]|nr:MAG: MarR family transcriptional regulator [Caulobacteraceae bacterium]
MNAASVQGGGMREVDGSEVEEIVSLHMQTLGYALQSVQARYQKMQAETLAGTGLSVGQAAILDTLWRRQQQTENSGESLGLTQTQLGRIANIEKSSLVILLDDLERHGWTQRRRHPSDRRAHLVHLTDEGAFRYPDLRQRLGELEDACFSTFTPPQRRRMLSDLAKLSAALANPIDGDVASSTLRT